MREQLTGHAYSSAKEKREKKGARDSKRNELSPGATCLAICITLQVLQGALRISESRRGGRSSDIQRGGKRNYFLEDRFLWFKV